MLRRTYNNEDCPVARALEVVGERWTLLIVRDALGGVTRFSEFRDRLGIAASVLASRLDRLLAAGVLERERYHTRPDRYVYRLTAHGRELATVVLALAQWGEYYRGRHPMHRAQHDEPCGGAVECRLVCQKCRRPVAATTVFARSPGSSQPSLPPPGEVAPGRLDTP